MPIESIILTTLVLIAGFYMAWNIGANDVSNAMGTSVGSGALTLVKAVIIAGILEFCGAFFLGGNVSQTMQQGIINPTFFADQPRLLLLGMLSSLIATAIWLQIASYFGWPVSTTHAIVGSLVGFGALIGGLEAVYWTELGTIALSWIVTPAISALFAYIIFSALQRNILFAINPIQATRRCIPILTAVVLFVFTISLLIHGIGSFHVALTTSIILLIALTIGIIGAIISIVILRTHFWSHEKILSTNVAQQLFSLNKATNHLQKVYITSKGSQKQDVQELIKKISTHRTELEDHAKKYASNSDFTIVEKMFALLQILSASYVAFAHGANDVANAIGPVAASIALIKTGVIHTGDSSIPLWLLALGGSGIVIGLATWGWRVMETIGKKITELTPTRGFSAEFGAAITILLASQFGLPISTTHCIVGAVLGVGLAKGISALNIRVLREIVLSWIITIPSSAIVCILIFYLMRAIFL